MARNSRWLSSTGMLVSHTKRLMRPIASAAVVVVAAVADAEGVVVGAVGKRTRIFCDTSV